MKKILKIAAGITAVVLSVSMLAGCGEKNGNNTKNKPQKDPTECNSEIINKLPEKGTFSQEVYDEILKGYDITRADNVLKTSGNIAWWDDYPRFTGENTNAAMKKIYGDASSTVGQDEGRGPFARNVGEASVVSTINALHKNGKKAGVWMETQGTTTMFIMSLNQLEDGSFETDSKTGAAKVYGWHWGWENTNPGVKPNANYICWAGVHSFVNNEEWAYPYVISQYPDLPLPTYPDGRIATGYIDGGDMSTPHLAALYDSGCAKDINGGYAHARDIEEEARDTVYCGEFYDKTTAKKVKYTYLNLGKDTADPFWIEYAKMTVDYWVALGVDYFWCDNWNGWDAINNCPIYNAFGDWSEFKFKEYLKRHPEVGVKDPDNFSITDYLKQKALELDPDCINTYVGDPVWSRTEWRHDRVWMAYLCFKAETDMAYNSAFYDAVKAASLKYRGDENAVAVCGNDFPYMTFGATNGEKLDIISTEYGTTYSAATAFNTSGEGPNRYNGHFYRLVGDTVRSHNACVWYYAGEYPYTDTSGKINEYEALSHNIVLHGAFAGTKKSITESNYAIEVMKGEFSDRREYGGIGVVYSPESELSYMAVGSWCVPEMKNPHDLAYMGWCSALDELNVPYKSIQMQRLADRIEGVELLILPEISSIDDEVLKVLEKFLDDGGTLVVTGADSGRFNSQKNVYTERESAALADLVKNYRGKNGRTYFFEEDPCIQYFISNKNSTFDEMYDLYLKNIEELVNQWYEKGFTTKYLTLEGVGPQASILSSLNYSYSNEAFFVDIVNKQYEPSTDELKPMPESLTVKVRVPSMLWGKGYSVYLYTNGAESMIELKEGTDFSVYGPELTVTIPSFEVYATIMVK